MSLWLFFTRAILDWNVSGTNRLDAFGILQCNTEAAFLEKISRTVYCLRNQVKSSGTPLRKEISNNNGCVWAITVYCYDCSFSLHLAFWPESVDIRWFDNHISMGADVHNISTVCYAIPSKIIFDRHRIYDILGY